jgi:hypothetical protein
MALEISKHRIAIAIAEHPNSSHNTSSSENPGTTIVHQLEPIPYLTHSNISSNNNNDEKLSSSPMTDRCNENSSKTSSCREAKERVCEQIESLAKEHGVCGFVIGWPLERSGQPGSSCGRVLHLLDYFSEERKNSILNKNRPITLWDERHFTHQEFQDRKMPQDGWGRSLAFCHSPLSSNSDGSTTHIIDGSTSEVTCDEEGTLTYTSSNREQSYTTSNDSTVASLILNEFMKTHWDDTIDVRNQNESNYDEYEGIKEEDARDEKTYQSVSDLNLLLERISCDHIEPSLL